MDSLILHIHKYAPRAFVYALIFFLVLGVNFADALVRYAPSSTLGLSSVQGKHILDNTLLTADINRLSLFTFDKFTIGSTTERSASLTLISSTTLTDILNVMSSTTAALFNVQEQGDGTPLVGIGSSSPYLALGVVGSARITGDLTVDGAFTSWAASTSAQQIYAGDNISASSTITQDGGQVLLAQTSGRVGVASSTPTSHALEVGGNVLISGTLTVGASDFGKSCVERVSTSTEQDMMFATTTFGVYKNLQVRIDSRGLIASGVLGVRFNGDMNTNYGYTISAGGAADSTDTNRQQIILETTGGTGPYFAVLDINNATTSTKTVSWAGMRYTLDNSAPSRFEGAGVWNNTAGPIDTLVVLEANGSGTSTPGMEITICGW